MCSLIPLLGGSFIQTGPPLTYIEPKNKWIHPHSLYSFSSHFWWHPALLGIFTTCLRLIKSHHQVLVMLHLQWSSSTQVTSGLYLSLKVNIPVIMARPQVETIRWVHTGTESDFRPSKRSFKARSAQFVAWKYGLKDLKDSSLMFWISIARMGIPIPS